MGYFQYNTKKKREYLNFKKQEFIHQHLLILLDNIVKLFDKYGIPYFIHSGTLLGAVREQNIILHDDDVDIAIFPESKDFVLSSGFTKELKKLNLKVEFSEPRLMEKEIIKLKYLKANHEIFIDIFVFEKEQDKIQYHSPECREIWKNGYFLMEEVFPLKKYKIRNYWFDGPKNPIPYLERHYGNWKVPKIRKRNHLDEINLNDNCDGYC